MQASVDSRIRIARSDLPNDVEEQIRQYLSIPNQAKAKALERGDWGAEDMPDAIDLYSYEGTDLIMPRGFAHVLRAGVENVGLSLEWDDRTVSPSIPLRLLAQLNGPVLREDQEKVSNEIIRQRQGIISMPTGAGKTVVGLETWRRAGVTGLVVVNNIGLAQQWIDRSIEHLDYQPGLIGDNTWYERPLTIAMAQTLHRRRHELQRDGFFARQGMTIYDEAHHCIAMTYRELIDLCVSRYMVGKTATPLDGDWRQPILLNLIGPVVLKTTSTEVTPIVRVVKTSFKWIPDANEEKLVDSRAIYRHVIKALEQNGQRIDLIARTISSQPHSCAQLVICKRLEYLDKIYDALRQLGYARERIFMMRGEESRERRAEIAELADTGHCVILSTVAGEGTDIKRLDRIHLVWPMRSPTPVIQGAGRGLRWHRDKTDTIILDYADVLQGVLRSQFYARANNVYREKGWEIQFDAKGENGG